MPRPLRVQFPGAWHHVMNRGSCHQDIFLDRFDRERFLALLGEACRRFDIEVHAFCLMRNHFHLLVRTPNERMDEFVQFFASQYTMYFNRRHGRDGALLRGRYKSLLVDDEAYLLGVSRYIHRNPTAFLGSDFADYRWSSYPVYLGERKADPWLVESMTLEIANGREQYCGFVDAPLTSNIDMICERNTWPSSISEGLADLRDVLGLTQIPQPGSDPNTATWV